MGHPTLINIFHSEEPVDVPFDEIVGFQGRELLYFHESKELFLQNKTENHDQLEPILFLRSDTFQH
jgi:hypothetical protein